ncbi:hypothetical protein L1049_011941 [Liquidambar formosana]|uniref:KIB1-4 beta-propeller domain-containing protein n=1 Tax=Liquidambar formosana TaxID=63359 RepID=A0AAP0X070_LIQFO
MLLVDLATKVYKLDEAKRKWVEMTSLGDRVLYVDEHCTFSVSSREVTGCKGSRIYHASRYLCFSRVYTEVFNLEDGEWQDLDECFLGVSLEGVGGLSLSLDVSHVPGLSCALVDAELSNKERAVDTPISKKKKKKERERKRRKKKHREWW